MLYSSCLWVLEGAPHYCRLLRGVELSLWQANTNSSSGAHRKVPRQRDPHQADADLELQPLEQDHDTIQPQLQAGKMHMLSRLSAIWCVQH